MYAHVHAHAHTHLCTHGLAHTYPHMQAHTHTRTYTHTHTHTHTTYTPETATPLSKQLARSGPSTYLFGAGAFLWPFLLVL